MLLSWKPIPNDLAASNPSAKVFAKAEASQKQKASAYESDDDDVCYEIPLVTPIHSATMIPFLGNKGGGSAAPVAEGSNTQDSQGKGIMIDADVAPSKEFFPFSPGPYFASYTMGGSFCLQDCGSSVSNTGEMVRIKALSSDQLTANMSVLHCLMMSHGGEILARYRSLRQPHREVQAELISLAASTGFERGLGMHQTKKEFVVVLGKISQFVPEAQAEPLSVILQLEPEKLARPANVLASRDTCFSPPLVKRSTVTHVSESLELPSNVVHASSTTDLEPNEEWMNVMVDGPDHEMTNGAVHAKPGSMFVHGTSYVVDDATKLTVIGPERVSSGPSDIVVALSVGEKGDGYVPSSIVDEEAAGEWLPPRTLSIAGQASIGSMGLLLLPGVALAPFITYWYMLSLQRWCSSELFAWKEEIIVTHPPVLCQSFCVLTLPSHIFFVFAGNVHCSYHYPEKVKVELDGKIVKEEEEAVKRIKGEVLKEKDDPGSFIFLIRLEGQVNENALADTRLDINSMPYRNYEQLGREDMKKVNHTQAEAMGILINVLYQVGATTLFAKFLILNILIDRDSPIVVGRGFIRTIDGIVNTPERLFSTFNGFCHQTFRAARSNVMRNAQSDCDDKEDY
nr:hypothetical protein [Tanacetum cinerariifolium]